MNPETSNPTAIDSEDGLEVAPDEYEGPATISTDHGEAQVQVILRSYFEPIDGHSRWIGRIAASKALGELCSSGDTVAITAGSANAVGKLSDLDTWGRFRIGGTGRAPIPVQ